MFEFKRNVSDNKLVVPLVWVQLHILFLKYIWEKRKENSTTILLSRGGSIMITCQPFVSYSWIQTCTKVFKIDQSWSISMSFVHIRAAPRKRRIRRWISLSLGAGVKPQHLASNYARLWWLLLLLNERRELNKPWLYLKVAHRSRMFLAPLASRSMTMLHCGHLKTLLLPNLRCTLHSCHRFC